MTAPGRAQAPKWAVPGLAPWAHPIRGHTWEPPAAPGGWGCGVGRGRILSGAAHPPLPRGSLSSGGSHPAKSRPQQRQGRGPFPAGEAVGWVGSCCVRTSENTGWPPRLYLRVNSRPGGGGTVVFRNGWRAAPVGGGWGGRISPQGLHWAWGPKQVGRVLPPRLPTCQHPSFLCPPLHCHPWFPPNSTGSGLLLKPLAACSSRPGVAA